QTVIGRVLRDQIQFLYAIRDELFRLANDIGLHAASMTAAHLWNDAETARMIAALGNFHVGKMSRRETESRRRVIGNINGSHGDIENRSRRNLRALRFD